jgi:hypothetical protein
MFGDVPVLGDLDLFEPLGTSSSSSSNDNFGFSFFFAFFAFTPDVLGLHYQPFLLYASRRNSPARRFSSHLPLFLFQFIPCFPEIFKSHQSHRLFL